MPSSQSLVSETAKGSKKQGSKKKGSKKKEAIIMSGRSQGNSSSSGGSGGSYRASPSDQFAEVDYSNDFFGNSRYAATSLYYDISGERRPVPSLEVESDAEQIVKSKVANC